jgi:hypothetical protein
VGLFIWTVTLRAQFHDLASSLLHTCDEIRCFCERYGFRSGRGRAALNVWLRPYRVWHCFVSNFSLCDVSLRENKAYEWGCMALEVVLLYGLGAYTKLWGTYRVWTSQPTSCGLLCASGRVLLRLMWMWRQQTTICFASSALVSPRRGPTRSSALAMPNQARFVRFVCQSYISEFTFVVA